jgi:3-deoxy-D-manno-octulosonic-acid transferase
VHVIYQALSYLVIGGLLPLLFLHPKLRQGIKRRLGLYKDVETPWPKAHIIPPAGPRIWLHGASAGDLIALSPIINEIRRLQPNATLLVSTMTNSGFQIARDRLAQQVDGITYVPYDLPGCTKRAVRTIRPDLLVLEYTEIWPNLIEAARRSGSKVAMTNGRISEALLSRYRIFHRVIGNQLAKFDLLLMREEVEAERALMLGAPPERVFVTGNTKFDNVAKGASDETIAGLKAAFRLEGERVFVAGSTHEGEEKDLFRCFLGMRAVDPKIRMIVAPRYVERSQRISALARSENLTVALRSEGLKDRVDVMVLDTMGELIAAYALASLVFVGGSFVTRGGQNILEPAGQGRPVLFGPFMMNFRDSVEVLLGRGGIQVQSPAQLEKVAQELLGRPHDIVELGTMAKTAVNKLRGASIKNAELLLSRLRTAS